MARVTIKGRVIKVVHAWAPGPETARPTSKYLARIWVKNRQQPYDKPAKDDLIRRLKREFTRFRLVLTAGSFGSLTSVQSLVDYIEAL